MNRRSTSSIKLPRFVVFEGVDGAAKSTLADALAGFYETSAPDVPLWKGAFPGSDPGTLGKWVYRLHHGEFSDLSPTTVAPPALQLLHVAAHVDAVLNRITPALRVGCVILDRYWWSTYAYGRRSLSPERAWALVSIEPTFWQGLPEPDIIYVSREISLKAHEIDPLEHSELTGYYREVIGRERAAGVHVHELHNDGSLDDTLQALLAVLGLTHQVQ